MTGQKSRGSPILIVFLACSILLLSLSELFRLYSSSGDSSTLSRIAFLALGVAFIPYFTLREWVMTAMACAMSLGIWLTGPTDAILGALDKAAFFAAFIYLVTLLKEAAQRSGSVLELGRYLTQQPQGRRYYSLSIGGHIMGVLLNFGAISLMTPLIQRGAKAMARDSKTHAQLEQQQISALLRGFSWMIIWSPTALTQAVLYTSFPTANALTVMPLGIGASLVMILIGRALDRMYWRHRLVVQNEAAPEFPRRAFQNFTAICLSLICATFIVVVTLGKTAAIALMLVAPIMMVFWIFGQVRSERAPGAFRATGGVLSEIFFHSVRVPAQSAYVLGIAGYIGVAAAALAPVDDFALLLSEAAIPAWLILTSLPILITLGGQLALSPLIVVVFLAAILNALPVLPADPNLIVFALGAGWALSMTASPNASATLLIASITRIAPTTLTWRWNGVYAIICFLVFTLSFVLLTL